MSETWDCLREVSSRRALFAGDLSEDIDQSARHSRKAVDRSSGTGERQDHLLKPLARVSEQGRSLVVLKEMKDLTVAEFPARAGPNVKRTLEVELLRPHEKPG